MVLALDFSTSIAYALVLTSLLFLRTRGVQKVIVNFGICALGALASIALVIFS